MHAGNESDFWRGVLRMLHMRFCRAVLAYERCGFVSFLRLLRVFLLLDVLLLFLFYLV